MRVVTLFLMALAAVTHSDEVVTQREVKLSPDGAWLAYIENVGATPYVWIARAHNPADRSALTTWDRGAVAYAWAADSSNIVMQRRRGDGDYELGVFALSRQAVVWHRGSRSESLQRFGLSHGGVLFALEVDEQGVRTKVFPEGRPSQETGRVAGADRAILDKAGMLAAYRLGGQWYWTACGHTQALVGQLNVQPISVEAETLYATTRKDGVGRQLVRYQAGTPTAVVIASLGDQSAWALGPDGLLAFRPDADQAWIGLSTKAPPFLAFATSRGFGASEWIQVSADGRTWLLKLDPVAVPGAARYAVFHGESMSFAMLFGPTGSALGTFDPLRGP
ncbi:hypothetical protein [Dyella sp. EPa41]|uniref:hypothetical protein n=1 Tax=Dyella sp. EPa41 TaxID=1561194 RepID=UPI0019152202|nr:hypothetical protein [Dyella sp. EPa41]